MASTVKTLYKPRIIDDKKLHEEVVKSMNNYARFLLKDFEKTVTTFKRKPSFTKRLNITPSSVGIQITPSDNDAGKIWGYLDKGTKGPYPIPKPGNTGAKKLRWRTGGAPKTFPNSTITVGGSPANGEWRSKWRVMHPGIKARNFTKIIAEQHQSTFTKWMHSELNRIVKEAMKEQSAAGPWRG